MTSALRHWLVWLVCWLFPSSLLPFSFVSCTGSGGQQRAAEGADAAVADGPGSTVADDALGLAPAPIFCSDAELAAAMEAANQTEVAVAQAVRDGLASSEAIALEEKLLTDHSLLLEMVLGAARSARIVVADNGVARALASHARGDTATLGALTGPTLDRAYVDREVLAHVESLGLLDRVFAPEEANDPLGYAIESMRELELQHAAVAIAAQHALEGHCTGAGGP
jgi:predicted outer membrane protein